MPPLTVAVRGWTTGSSMIAIEYRKMMQLGPNCGRLLRPTAALGTATHESALYRRCIGYSFALIAKMQSGLVTQLHTI
jgi:hypothetical protein